MRLLKLCSEVKGTRITHLPPHETIEVQQKLLDIIKLIYETMDFTLMP